jgi:hypothetical protein
MFDKKRGAVRIEAAVPVELEKGSGVTTNFSQAGVYFVSDQTFALGDCIPFTLLLDEPSSRQELRMECYGCVVRVEAHGAKVGTAVTIDSFWLTRSGEKQQ